MLFKKEERLMIFLKLLLSVAVASCFITSAAAAEVHCTPQTTVDVTKIAPQVVLVGERHGTKEIPAFVAGFVCSLLKNQRPVILAIETDGAEQEALNRYLASTGGDPDRAALIASTRWQDECQDGRKSEAMLALIESMRRWQRSGARVAIVALGANENWNVPLTPAEEAAPLPIMDQLLASLINDRLMSDHLLLTALLYRNYTIVSLSGFMHSSTLKGNRQDPEFLPMGYRIIRQQPAFVIGFETGAGTAWNSGPNGCKATSIGAQTLYSDKTQIDAVVKFETVTASPPAKDRTK
jgi:hypothetical protein